MRRTIGAYSTALEPAEATSSSTIRFWKCCWYAAWRSGTTVRSASVPDLTPSRQVSTRHGVGHRYLGHRGYSSSADARSLPRSGSTSDFSTRHRPAVPDTA
eukprot:2253076-Rhodomonas_salina.3